MLCPACGKELAPDATFCPDCRIRGSAPLATPVGTPVLPPPTPRPPAPDRHERFFLIVACLVSAGALAIPRLRRSKAFGPTGKAVLGTLAALQTIGAVVLIAFFWIKGPALIDRYVHWLGHRTGRY
jgi:hypothetical protein